MKTFLGIDCGTQSRKVLVYEPKRGKVIARAHAPHELISRNDGTRKQQAHWWTDALKKVLRAIDPVILATVSAVGVSGQQHGFVPLGKQGRVLAPVKLWCDTSTTTECAEITSRFGGKEKLIEQATEQFGLPPRIPVSSGGSVISILPTVFCDLKALSSRG